MNRESSASKYAPDAAESTSLGGWTLLYWTLCDHLRGGRGWAMSFVFAGPFARMFL